MLQVKSCLLLSSFLALTALGCTGGSDPTQTEATVAEGLRARVDPSNPNLVKGTFARNGHFISFEALAGAGTESGRPIDVRIADASGQVFFLQFAGDAIDSSWNQEIAAPSDVQTRALDFELVKELEPAIAALPGSESSEVYQLALAQLRAISSGLRLENPPAEAQPTGNTAQATYRHFFNIYSEKIFGGYHSSTFLEVYAGNTRLSSKSNCNHGHCPLGGYMSLYCYRYYDTFTSTLPPSTNCGGIYNASSLGDGHNCHDDTLLQEAEWARNTTLSSCWFACCDPISGQTGMHGCYDTN